MSVSCGIYLRERGNISNSKNLGPFLTEWEFTLLRNQGCGALTFAALMSESAWATYEPYCVIDELAHVYFKMNDPVEYRTWSGTLEDIPDPSATPPERTLRRFRARPTWAQFENPGARALWVFDNQTVKTMVGMLAVYFGAAQTTVTNSTTEIIAGADYTVVQAILEDAPVGPTIRKLAEINQATVFGVNGRNDRVYFRDETPASTAPDYTFRMGVHADGVVKFSRKQRRGQRANAFLVEGRDAKSGNPMFVIAYDSALDSHADPIWRWKQMRAPELVSGPDIKRWAEWLVAKEKDPLEEGTLEIAGINTFLTSGAIRHADVTDSGDRGLNCNVAVKDEGGAPIQYLGTYNQWPLQSITYRMTNSGSYDATLKLGNALPIDAMDELGVRDLLRELAIFEAKEFSNQIEVQADDDPWPTETYVTFLALNRMRSNVRIRLDNRIAAIDLDATDPSDGTKLCLNLKTDYGGGITGDGGGDVTGQFVTTAIGVGDSYDTWALLRRVSYPMLIEGQEGAGRDSHFYQPWVQTSANEGTLTPSWGIRNMTMSDGLNTIKQQHIIPSRWTYIGTQQPHDGFLLHNTPIAFQTDIIFEFWWGVPYSSTGESRYLVLNYKDVNNYYFVEMKRGGSDSELTWRMGKIIGGSTTYSPLGWETITVGTSGNGNLIRATVAANTISDSLGVTVANTHVGYEDTSTQYSQSLWWQPDEEMVNAGFRWRMDYTGSPGMPGDTGSYWHIKKMAFTNALWANNWYISRDGEASWEGPFDASTGVAVNLGAYAGGGTESTDIYIKGFVAYPQILTGVAAGWKNA